jgi:hypothetical protein
VGEFFVVAIANADFDPENRMSLFDLARPPFSSQRGRVLAQLVM